MLNPRTGAADVAAVRDVPVHLDDQLVDIDQQHLAQPRQVLMSRCGRSAGAARRRS